MRQTDSSIPSASSASFQARRAGTRCLQACHRGQTERRAQCAWCVSSSVLDPKAPSSPATRYVHISLPEIIAINCRLEQLRGMRPKSSHIVGGRSRLVQQPFVRNDARHYSVRESFRSAQLARCQEISHVRIMPTIFGNRCIASPGTTPSRRIRAEHWAGSPPIFFLRNWPRRPS